MMFNTDKEDQFVELNQKIKTQKFEIGALGHVVTVLGNQAKVNEIE